MIGFIMDIVLTLLLLAAIGFGGISVIGLLIFPDIRSRSFTGLRAGILSLAFVTSAGICYGLYSWYITDGQQYLLFTLASIVILILVIALNKGASGPFSPVTGSQSQSPQDPGQKQ